MGAADARCWQAPGCCAMFTPDEAGLRLMPAQRDRAGADVPVGRPPLARAGTLEQRWPPQNAPARARTQPVRPAAGATTGPAFADVLRDAQSTQPVQFSKHALQRLERRQLDVDPTTLNRLAGGIDRAAGKGSRDAVVLVDDTAFVCSVKNRTVITAVGRDQMKDHVFTNIDSAVVA